MSTKIYGKQWGTYPSDSELGLDTDIDDCCDHYFTYLCTDDCMKTIEKSSDIISSILNDIMEIVERAVGEAVHRPDYYTEKYGVIPREWIDEGRVIGLIYDSNSEETIRLWGTSLAIRLDVESSDEEEYDAGDVADYHRHREIYRD